MKKIFYYLPALVSVIYWTANAFMYSGINLQYWLIRPLLFLLAGFLLSEGYIKGAILGLLPTIDLLYISVQKLDKGLNAGFVLSLLGVIFYTICIFYIRKNRKQKDHE